MNPLDYVLLLVDQATQTFITDTFANIAAAAGGTIRNMLILYFILYGLALWRGKITGDVTEFIFHVFKLSIIYGLVFNWTLYNAYIVDFLTNGPDALAGIIVGSPSGSVTDVVGDAYVTVIQAADRAYDKSGWLMPGVLGTTIMISGTILIIFVTFLLSIAKIALAVLVGIGGIPLLLLMFNGTQRMFESWLQQCLNFFLYIVLTIAVMAIGGTLYQRAVDSIPDSPGLIDLGSLVPLILIGFTISLILKQVPALASSIAGGVQISSLGAESMPGRQLSGMYNHWRRGRGRNNSNKPSLWSRLTQRGNSVRR